MLATLAFYLFAIVMTLSAVAVITARNPVHSVLFLILAFFNAAGLFVMLGAEFLAMILVIVYVGAVAVLFLFVVMMLDIEAAEVRASVKRHLPVGLLVGALLFAQLAFVVCLPEGALHAPLSPQLATAADLSNTAALGQVLYTRYAIVFQACGMVLLVAMIGAITLTLRPRRPTTRQQNQDAQIERARDDAVALRQPQPGEGVQL